MAYNPYHREAHAYHIERHQPQYYATHEHAQYSSHYTSSGEPRPHAPRRVQHGYSEEYGAYIYDAGAYDERQSARYTPHGHRHSTDEGQPYYGHSSRRQHGERHKEGFSNHHSSKSSSSSSSSPSDKSASATPRTPDMGRLATPELPALSAGLRFCNCGCSKGHEEQQQKYIQGRASMDAKVQNAMEYMAKSTASREHDRSDSRRRGR